MNQEPASGIDASPIDRFFASWRPDSPSVLCIDYDGTLAPFVADRHSAFPYPGVRSKLQRIKEATQTRLIVVSGRAVDEVKRLLGLETPIEIWGNHGLQRLRPDSGETETFDLPGEARDGIEAARDAARELDVGDRVEQKPGSVAVHVRGLAADKAKALLETTREQWEPIVERFDDVEIHAFDGGLEFRSSAIDKGYAIRAILDELPSPDTPIAYLGDDRTDEDAFDALGERGLKVLVRQECRPTAADVWLQPPEELLQLLDRWGGSAESSIHESKGSP